MHLYSPNGNPVYQVPYADPPKGLRDATLADARKFGLYPSVTEILNVLTKPGLEAWKIDQMMMACRSATRRDDEDDEAFLKRVKSDASEASRLARDTGQAIHDAVEKTFKELKPTSHDGAAWKICEAICDKYGWDGWQSELSFASPLGYGGRIDLINKDKNIIIDLKTKEKFTDKKMAYDEHAMQLIAYAKGVDMPDAKLINVFADWNGETVFHEWSDTYREWDMFLAAFGLWKLVKKYDPLKVIL